jgi:hypothetical protein
MEGEMMKREFVMNAAGKAKMTVGKYRIEYDRTDHRFSVFAPDGVCISTHGHIKDALNAAKRYVAGDKRRGIR